MTTKKELYRLDEKQLDELIRELKIKVMKPLSREEKIMLVFLELNKKDAVYDPVHFKL